jgi:polyisoprenoid-binding protein YceI
MSFFRRKPKTSPAPKAAPAVPAPASAAAVAKTGSVLTGDYTIDASHTRLGFSARHAMVTTVRGSFGDFEGTAHVDAETPANSRVDLTIRTASISTGSAD